MSIVQYTSDSLSYLTSETSHPTTAIESAANFCLKPLQIIQGRGVSVILKKSDHEFLIYHHAMRSISPFFASVKKITSYITIPFSIIGTTLKGVNLICSPQAREIFTHWKTSNFIPFHNMNYGDSNIKSICLYIDSYKPEYLPKLLEEIVYNPRDYFINDYIPGGTTYTVFPGFELKECACHNDKMNRLKNDNRLNIENKIVDSLTQDFPPLETEQLNYCSLGSGGELQEFMLIGKLLLKGYKNINVHLVEPCYSDNKINAHYDDELYFLIKVSKQLNSNLVINRYKNIHDIPNGLKFHCIAAIDYDDISDTYYGAFKDFLSAPSLLEQGAKIFLNTGDFNFIFDQTNLLSSEDLSGKVQEISFMLEKLLPAIKSGNVDSFITIIDDKDHVFMHIILLNFIFKNIKNVKFPVFIHNDIAEHFGKDNLKRMIEYFSKNAEISFFNSYDEIDVDSENFILSEDGLDSNKSEFHKTVKERLRLKGCPYQLFKGGKLQPYTFVDNSV